MNTLMKLAEWVTRFTMKYIWGHDSEMIETAIWYHYALHKEETDMWNKGLKAIHASGLAVTLATVLIFATGGMGVWGQGLGLMQGERLLVAEQQMKYMDLRVERLEAVQADTRIKLMEAAVADIKESANQNKWLALGQLMGLLGIGAGQVVVVRGNRRRKWGSENGGNNGPEVNENAD